MSIGLTDELEVKTKKGKLAAAKQIFLEGDKETVQQIGEKTHQLENAVKDITTTGGASTANAVSYSNSTSGMTAVTAQGAIDELVTKNKSQDTIIAAKAEKSDVQAAVSELKDKDSVLSAEIAKKANSADVSIQMQTEQTRVNDELAKKFNSENIVQESGEADDKVMSQKAVSTKFIELQGEIVRSEKTIDETVNSKYVNGYKTIVNDKYNAYSIDYYSVEANKYVKIISKLSGENVAAISLMKEKNSEITSIFDISKSTTDVLQVNRTLLIPEGINYVAVSRNIKYTSKCFVIGEGQSKIEELENTKADKVDVNKEFKNVSLELDNLSNTTLSVTSKELLGIVREVYVDGIEDIDSVYTITVTKNTSKLHIYISKGSETISNYYASSTQSDYNVNKKGIIELSPMGDNGKKAYVFADFSKKELGFSKNSNLDIAVASYLDFAPSIKSMLNQKQITGLQASNKKNTEDISAITEGQLAINKAIEKKNNNLLYGKTLLAIGDSIVAQNYWQKQVGLLLGMKVRTHAKGGIGIVQMVDGDGSGDAPEGYDPDTFGVSQIYRLNTEDVKDASVIILMGFYNERSELTNPGVVTDMYPDNNTIAGKLNYATKRVYEELSKANNNTCRLVICSAHRYGKYSYIDKDSYNDGDELLKVTKMVAEHQSIPCIDLMHNGGINKYNWNLFQKKSTPFNSDYIAVDGINNGTNKPFDNIEDFPPASENKGKYVTLKGTADRSYQSDGETWVLKNTPAPWNADQLHLSPDGGKILGNYIAAKLLSL